MEKSRIKSFAFKWFFFSSSGTSVYAEFFHVFLKQLGLNSQQIGLTNLFGALCILVPLFLFIGDRYRARNLISWIILCFAFVTPLLPILPIIMSLPTCFQTGKIFNNSSKILRRCYTLLVFFQFVIQFCYSDAC